MKRIFYITGLSLLLCLGACQKMEDVHKQYLDDGEIIYSPKPLKVMALSGRERVLIKYLLNNAVNVNNCIIEWEEGAYSKEINISPDVPSDTLEVLVENLEEKTYLFNIYTIDGKGNRSIKVPVTGASYGAKYESTLTNRPLKSYNVDSISGSMMLVWGVPDENNIGVNLTYSDSSGTIKELWVKPVTDTTIIANWGIKDSLTMSSYYLPDSMAIDTFISSIKHIVLP